VSCWNPPGSQTCLWSFPCAPSVLLLLLLLRCCCFLLPSCSSLVVSADSQHQPPDLHDHLIQLLQWLVLLLQSPQLQKFLAIGKIIMISHAFSSTSNFTCWMCTALHFYPFLQGFHLFPHINQTYAVCVFFCSATSHVALFSASVLKMSSHSSECSFLFFLFLLLASMRQLFQLVG
jgi:hypothetical protein